MDETCLFNTEEKICFRRQREERGREGERGVIEEGIVLGLISSRACLYVLLIFSVS